MIVLIYHKNAFMCKSFNFYSRVQVIDTFNGNKGDVIT